VLEQVFREGLLDASNGGAVGRDAELVGKIVWALINPSSIGTQTFTVCNLTSNFISMPVLSVGTPLSQ
jgi:hypothetical protein